MQNYQDKQKNRQIINARSLSLEVTKHKHRIAAQLVSKNDGLFVIKRIIQGVLNCFELFYSIVANCFFQTVILANCTKFVLDF